MTTHMVPKAFQPRRLAKGFHLIELIIAITIAAILVAFAIPGFQNSMANARTKAAAQAFFLTLQQARTEAIKFNGLCDVRIRPTDTTDWALGWSIVAENPGTTTICSFDDDFDGTTADITVDSPIGQWNALDRVVITGAPAEDLDYDRNGRLQDDISTTPIIICDDENRVFQREVRADTSGLPEINLSETKCS